LAGLCFASAALLPAVGQAAGSLLLIDPPPEATTWAGGLTARSWPSAPGGVQRTDGFLPALDVATPNGAFASTDSGVGWNLAALVLDAAAAKQWQWGARLWPQFGRPKRYTPAGIDRLGPRVTTETFLNVQASPYVLLQSGFSWGSGRHRDGAQLELGATSGIPIGDDLIGVSLATTFANRAQLRSSFGVGPGESLASGLPVWRPGAGWQDWSLALGAEHKFNADWSISGQWLNTRLVNAAARSPLTQTASQSSYTLTLWRHF
jgi:outer membrane scaffolding protein for murein synthesis (MipA/OmpV family)